MRRLGQGRASVLPSLMIFPAIALGVLAMICGGVSPALWGQQAGAWVLLALLAMPLRRVMARVSPQSLSVLFLVPLALALRGEAVGGARRWIDLIVFHAHAAELVIPALIVALHGLKKPHFMLLGAAVLLCCQPDLSQLAAFSAAALPILWRHREGRIPAALCTLILGALLAICVRIPVAIEPIDYCEGILAMLGNVSPLLPTVGWAALAAIPLCFAYRFLRRGQAQTLSLALYYAVWMLMALSGEYPVPFMGFGLSPIVGYALAAVLERKAA